MPSASRTFADIVGTGYRAVRNGPFSRTIARLRSAATLTHRMYGAISDAANGDSSARTTIIATTEALKRNTTSTRDQSGRFNLKNRGDQAMWNRKLTS